MCASSQAMASASECAWVMSVAGGVHVLISESTLDAQVAGRDGVVRWRRDLDDLVVLYVQSERAADTAIRADGVRAVLAGFVPGAVAAHVVLGLEHQRSRGAHRDAVAAIHAGRVRQCDVVFRADVGGESSTGDSDGKGV